MSAAELVTVAGLIEVLSTVKNKNRIVVIAQADQGIGLPLRMHDKNISYSLETKRIYHQPEFEHQPETGERYALALYVS